VVKIYLRRHAGQAASDVDQRPAVDAARAIGVETILVVEDDAALRNYATEILDELGYAVLSAGMVRARLIFSTQIASTCCSSMSSFRAA
jgi:hypothetical protein